MPRAILRINAVELVGPHSLALLFNDGASRRVNLLPELEGPVFEPLQDPEYFSRVVLDSVAGTVVWPNGADFAPEFLRGLPEEKIARGRERSPNSAPQRAGRVVARR
jgi:Protein of unknown function (DUF2442)